MKRAAKKTQPDFAAERAVLAIMGRINPIRGLTPERLSSYLDSFDLGHLRYAARVWQKIKDRDDTVKAVSEKRELAASLLNWEILPVDDTPEAETHKAALEDFYNNLVTTHALDTNQRGGVSTLIKQMMQAVGHKYAVHEIVWAPQSTGLSAEFRFVPLEYFENTAGRLRFLPREYSSTNGEELEEGGWMVTTGPGLMEATSVAYLFKQLPLKSWLVLCEKFAVPYLHGETPAAYGSTEWNAFRDALAAFANDGALVTSPGGKITPIQISGQSLPQEQLIDRMDRAISRLWRGNDLGTMSREGDATGSNPQESETDILEAADALIISETLQHYVDRWVCRYRFGTDEPKAYFRLQPTVRENQELQLKIDDYLIKWGVGRGKNDLREKYGRPEPDPSDELATAPAAAGPQIPNPNGQIPNGQRADGAGLVNERPSAFDLAARRELTEAQRRALAGPLARLRDLLEIEDEAELRAAAEKFQAELPALSRPILTDPATAKAWQEIIGTAVVSGFFEAATGRAAAGKSQNSKAQTPNKS